MTSFLFWNIYKDRGLDIAVELAREHHIDVLMLAECKVNPDIYLAALNSEGEEPYRYEPSLESEPQNLKVFTRLDEDSLYPVFMPDLYETDRVTIRQIQPADGPSALLAIVHLIAPVHTGVTERLTEALNAVRTIVNAENSVGHKRTVAVGDFNMNPWEAGMINAQAFHAVMDRRKAQSRSGRRRVRHKWYHYFYNPMWSLLGDSHHKRPVLPGTHYFSRSRKEELFWNMFDQVLVRPDLLDCFKHKHLRILHQTGTRTLLTRNGYPDSKHSSDHLPVLFRLARTARKEPGND